MSEPLSADLLQRLTSEIAASGAPIADALRPGLTREQQDSIVAPLGIELSDEARLWWGWRDGAEMDPTKPDQSSLGWVTPLPLERAVAEAMMMAEISRATADEGYDPWHVAWLPILGTDGASIVCDCGGDPDAPSAIRYVDFEQPDSFDPIVGSISEMVEFWISMLESGHVRFDRDAGRWVEDDSIPGVSDDMRALI